MVENPFEVGVPAYVEAEWDGLIPVKAETKLPVLRGVTGREGAQVTAEQAMNAHQSEFYRDKNIALRLPRGVVGVDVDDYESKIGGRTLHSLERSYGKLPPGPMSTARGFGVSGIRFFRVPENLEFESVFGDDIECIQFHHRFAVVWPSTHHTGERYEWYDADGNQLTSPPRKDDLPDLPKAWVDHFGHEPWEGYKNRVTFPGVEAFVDRFDGGDAPHLFAYAKSVFEDSAGSRHDSMLRALGRVTRDAVAGFYPAGPAIEELRGMYEEAIGNDRRNDFDDLLETTCADAMNTDVAAARERVLGEEPEFRVVQDGDPVLLVEGGDESLVPYLPEGFGLATAKNLSRVDDFSDLMDKSRVYLSLSGDAAEDLSVYEAGTRVADQLVDYDVGEAKFLRLPGGKSLPDFLDKFEEDIRAERLVKRLDRSLSDKPADRKPRSSGSRAKEKVQKILDESPTVTPLEDGRYQIRDNGDSREFYNNLVSAVRDVMSADRLFYFGGGLSERRDDTMHVVDKDYVRNPMVDAVRPVRLDPKTGDEYEFEFTGIQCGILLSRAFEFDELQKLSQAPFIRPDGTICQENGYDIETKTYLSLSEEFRGFEIPHTPTEEEVQAAVSLLDEAVHDFPFATAADRANAFAMYITPFIRNMAPTVPLAVVDGREPGVGKNLLAGIMSLVVTGKNLETNTYPNEEEEMRKTITAIFRSGKEMVCFDEAHHLTGKYLAQVLTSETWTDRTLGSSESIGYPNQTTWISLGNQVKIGGDLGRRVYRINLAYEGEDPASRPLDHYLHPDVKEWTIKNRPELVKACLTLVRNWFSKGQPAPTNGINMGSFERWVSIVGGILENAGVEGFLENVKDWTDESDSSRSYWIAHLNWLYDQFGSEEFTTTAVKAKLLQNNEHAPLGMEDVNTPNFTQKLGTLYRSYQDRRMDGLSLTRGQSKAHGNKAKWVIYRHDVDESNMFSSVSGGPVDPFNS